MTSILDVTVTPIKISHLRVARGGSWGEDSRGIRLANRLPLEPGLRSWFVGFRLAAPAELPPEVQLDLNRQAAQAEVESIEPSGEGSASGGRTAAKAPAGTTLAPAPLPGPTPLPAAAQVPGLPGAASSRSDQLPADTP